MTSQVPNQVPGPQNGHGRTRHNRGQAASISVRPRANGELSWRVTFRVDGRQMPVTFDTDRDAQWFAREVRTWGASTALSLLKSREDTSSSPAPTLADWMRHHVDQLRIEPGTRRTYLSQIQRDIAGVPMGDLPVTVITRNLVRDWIDYLIYERGLRPKSAQAPLSLMSAAFERAIEAGIVASNPARNHKLPKALAGAEKVFVEPDEFVILLRHIDPYYIPFVTTLYGTGLRWGEATALRVGDLHLDAAIPQLQVHRAWKTAGEAGTGGRKIGPPKSDAALRIIGLAPKLVWLLRQQIAGKTYTDLVFTNKRANKRIPQSSFWLYVWTPAVTALEAQTGKRPRVHDLRHSYASNLIHSGMDLSVVQYLMGHEKATTTMDTYTHQSRNAQALAAQASALSLAGAFPEIEA